MIASVILGLLALAAIALSFVLYKKTESQQASILFEQNEKMRILQEKEQLNLTAVQAQKEVELIKENLDYERKKRTEDEALLKEQLTAIAKDVVQQSNSTMKAESKVQLDQILEPFREKLGTFEKEVRDQKVKGVEQFASLESLVKALTDQHSKMNSTAQNLADALRGEQKTQGNWGELALERILEMSGLQEGTEYVKQATLRDEHNNMLRPDFLINLPDNKHVIVDSKVSLTAFERYINAENDDIRTRELKNHLVSINTHVKQLGDKNYTHVEGLNAPEFVLLFIPVESSFSLAIKEEPDIYAKAWEKRVVIVTPSTLLATLKTIESIWKQERQNKNAERIAIEAGRLYDKFVGFIDDMKSIEKKQNEAMGAYDNAMKKLSTGSGNILGKVETLKKLGAKVSKQIDSNLLEDNSEL